MATSNTTTHCFFFATSGLSTLKALNNLSLSSRSMNPPSLWVQFVMPRIGEGEMLCAGGKGGKLCSWAHYPVAASATLSKPFLVSCFVNAEQVRLYVRLRSLCHFSLIPSTEVVKKWCELKDIKQFSFRDTGVECWSCPDHWAYIGQMELLFSFCLRLPFSFVLRGPSRATDDSEP
jgi:hypothetical protein